jgi:hypothetical protein
MTLQFKEEALPTIINGTSSIIGNDTLLKNPIKPRSNNPESTTLHKVYVLGDSHLKHSVVELRNELIQNFKSLV